MSDELHLEKWHAEKNHWRESDRDLLKTRVHKGLRGQRSIFSMFFENFDTLRKLYNEKRPVSLYN